LLIALLAAVQAMAPIAIKRAELAPGIHQFTVAADGYVEQLNSVAVIGDDEVLVFDTTTRPSTARTILAEIRKLTPKTVRVVVNSHWHPITGRGMRSSPPLIRACRSSRPRKSATSC
jgi:hypothetical protein